MMLDTSRRILIVGLGLIGGSYARAFKKLGFRVEAITKEEASVTYALQHGIIDAGTTVPDPEVIGRADLVVFALYPTVFVEWIRENQHAFKAGALLTDVTGVKTTVVEQVQEMLRPDVEFIAAHPMAGREVYGVENSDENIFRGANYIVTPTARNSAAAIADCEEIGRLLGFAKVSILTPEKHDEMIGFLSQLTHCIAVALMTCNDDPNLKDYTGDSFRDLTRIARINDAMWSELFLMNKQPLLKQMDLFMAEFARLREALEQEDTETMREMMRCSTARRALFDKNK